MLIVSILSVATIALAMSDTLEMALRVKVNISNFDQTFRICLNVSNFEI